MTDDRLATIKRTEYDLGACIDIDDLVTEIERLRVTLAEMTQDRDDGDTVIEGLNKIMQEMEDCGDCQELERLRANAKAAQEVLSAAYEFKMIYESQEPLMKLRQVSNRLCRLVDALSPQETHHAKLPKQGEGVKT